MLQRLRERLARTLHHAARYDSFPIPLFPLDVVLFPGGKLSLKVHEARYIDMASACMKERQPFGVCLVDEGGEAGAFAAPGRVGCLADIVGWDMGEQNVLNLDIHGTRRFRIVQSRTRNNGLVVAQVDPVAGEPPQALPPGHAACAATLRRMVERLGANRIAPPLHFDDAVWVSYRLAELLPLKRSAQQSMLEMNDALVRLEILHAFLTRQGLLA